MQLEVDRSSAAERQAEQQRSKLGALRLSLGPSQRQAKKAKTPVDSSRVITRRDYRGIITLKIAGRPNKEIAARFGLPLDEMRGHIERAMAEYRKGAIKPEPGSVAGEAREKGKDDARDFVDALSDAYAEADSGEAVKTSISIDSETPVIDLPTLESTSTETVSTGPTPSEPAGSAATETSTPAPSTTTVSTTA